MGRRKPPFFFYFYCRARQRGAFWLDPWSEDQGVTGSALPAWWFRPHASYLRKEARCRASAKKLPRGTPWKGFLWTLPETKGTAVPLAPRGCPVRDFPSRALLRTFERSIVGGTTNLEDPTWRKANFLWKFLCAGGASLDYGGDPIPTAVPPQGFLQSKNALRRRKTVSSLLGSLVVEYPANWNAIADQSESAGKNRRSARQGRYCLTRTTGIAQGSADPCVFTRQRKKQLLRGGSTPRFFSQIRSVGSKRTSWQVSARTSPGPQVQPKAPRCQPAAKTKTLFPFGKISGII